MNRQCSDLGGNSGRNGISLKVFFNCLGLERLPGREIEGEKDVEWLKMA